MPDIKISKYMVAFSIVILSFVSVSHAQTEVDPPREGVFFHIKSGTGDAHTILMPLTLAVKLAPTHDVVLFFDVKGYKAVVKDAPNLQYSGFDDSHTLIKKLMDAGIGLYVCPICMNSVGITQDDLMEGVQVMKPEVFFGFTKGRILTLDY